MNKIEKFLFLKDSSFTVFEIFSILIDGYEWILKVRLKFLRIQIKLTGNKKLYEKISYLSDLTYFIECIYYLLCYSVELINKVFIMKKLNVSLKK